jgi:diguanylate cyclase (GGDEF)-like protein/PAS domain S-box-containing protein
MIRPFKAEPARQAAERHGLRRTTAVLLPLWLLAAVMAVIASISVAIMAILLAYVAGESTWSKGQKDAVHSLERYARLGDAADYRDFERCIAVPLGDRAAKLEMNRPHPDFAAIRRGFEQGHIAPADMDGMTWGYRTLKNTPWMRPAVAYWDKGDTYILRLASTGEHLHALAQAGKLGATESAPLVRELHDIDSQLAPIENGFSHSLDDAARAIRSLLTLALAASAFVLLAVFTQFIRRALDRSDRFEREVRKNEERLTLGFEGINAGLWDWEVGSRKCYFSSWLYEQIGYDVSTAAGTPFDSEAGLTQLLHADDLASVRHALRRHLAHSTIFDVEFRLRTLAGGYRWCRARGQAVRDARGRAVRMVGCLFDISDLKTAEANAQTERELAEVTLASIGEAVIRTDEDARVTYCNAVAERMLGRPAAEILKQPFEAICDLRNDADDARPFDVLRTAHAMGGASDAGEAGETDGKADGDTGMNPDGPATDLYVTRPDGSRLAVDYSVSKLRDARGRVIGTVIVLYDVSALREHAARLAYQATHDELTDIYNRREFERRLAALLDEGVCDPRDHPGHSVMFLDLDQFKVVNDTCGHSTGDELIRQVCSVLKKTLRSSDIVARLGGDEFGVVLPHCAGAHAWQLAESMREAIAAIRFTGAGCVVQTSVSIGLVADAASLSCVKEVMKAADVACYMAKKKGRNRVHRFRFDDAELSETHSQMALVADIKAALENDQFCLYGQEIMPLAPGAGAQDAHVELLLRMYNAAGELVSPAAFIGAAERFDLMPSIDRWVIAHAFEMIAAGVHRYDTWSINLSGASLGDERLADYIEAQQRLWAIPFARVCFEITETAAITNMRDAITLIERLRAQGCRFALDDFGAGMSSLNYLKHLNVDYLKIDGSFVRGIIDSELDQAIVRSINQVAHAAGKQTIAECVEDAVIVDCMIAMGIDFAQGYGVGRPAPLDALREPKQRDMAVLD